MHIGIIVSQCIYTPPPAHGIIVFVPHQLPAERKMHIGIIVSSTDDTHVSKKLPRIDALMFHFFHSIFFTHDGTTVEKKNAVFTNLPLPSGFLHVACTLA